VDVEIHLLRMDKANLTEEIRITTIDITTSKTTLVAIINGGILLHHLGSPIQDSPIQDTANASRPGFRTSFLSR
jgi:hypothetical protein